MNTDNKADASPTKAFFVNMITRDISLEDCILDLIDNSVDSAWRSEGNPPMSLGDDTNLSAYSNFDFHYDKSIFDKGQLWRYDIRRRSEARFQLR